MNGMASYSLDGYSIHLVNRVRRGQEYTVVYIYFVSDEPILETWLPRYGEMSPTFIANVLVKNIIKQSKSAHKLEKQGWQQLVIPTIE